MHVSELLFQEKQKIIQVWLWALLLTSLQLSHNNRKIRINTQQPERLAELVLQCMAEA